jgi:hypothetical protein
MNSKKIILASLASLIAVIANAQQQLGQQQYDPHLNKAIPDKLFEIGIPVSLILILIFSVVQILKNNGENRLKHRMIEKGISEETMKALFAVNQKEPMLNALKWFLILTAVGTCLIATQFLGFNFLSFGLLFLYLAFAFLIYYFILRHHYRK